METSINPDLTPPPVQPLPSPKKWYQHKGITAIIVLAIIACAVTLVYFSIQPILEKSSAPVQNNILNNQYNPPQSSLSLGSTTPIHLQQTATSTPISQDEGIYFGNGSPGKYSLVNVFNGQTKGFIPNGYEIVDQHNYDDITPPYLILKNDNELYSYRVSDGKLTGILANNNQPIISKNEGVSLEPSITEKDKFYIELNLYDPNEQNDLFGRPVTPLKTRSYFFDASTNTLTNGPTKPQLGVLSACLKYDSRNQRFFIWECGEGVGTSLPLSTTNLDGGEEKVIVSLAEFGLKPDDIGKIAVEYNNGYFLAMAKGSADKIMAINPSPKEPTKETYVIADPVRSHTQYPYSAAIVKDANTIIIGGGDSITLLRINVNGQIEDYKTIAEPELYANFIFPYKDKLYYQSRKSQALKIINLQSWEIEKTIPIQTEEEITLFDLQT